MLFRPETAGPAAVPAPSSPAVLFSNKAAGHIEAVGRWSPGCRQVPAEEEAAAEENPGRCRRKRVRKDPAAVLLSGRAVEEWVPLKGIGPAA